MMRWIAAFAGLLTGLVIAVVALLLNPVPHRGLLQPLSGDDVLTLRYQQVNSRGFDPSLPAFLGRPPYPEDRMPLPDPALRHLRTTMLVLTGREDGRLGLAVRTSALARDNSLLQGRLATEEHWLLGWPGEPGMVATASSNHWFMLRDELWSRLHGSGVVLYPRYLLSSLGSGRTLPEIAAAGSPFAGGTLREWVEPGQGRASHWVIQLQPPAPPPPAP
ncbi:MAG: hypothetical protein JJT85_08410 [Chromatiales bacterium]|nr:hypothetical protein [Chromatiales bacterium]